MRNLGNMNFQNIAAKSGLSRSEVGNTMAAMGADWGDYNGDGHLDLVVTNFEGSPNLLYRNQGHGLFEHDAYRAGIARPTMSPLGFGNKWGDFDNDGWLDLIFANGHVFELPAWKEAQFGFREPLQFFHNRQGQQHNKPIREMDRCFVEISSTLKPQMRQPILGRGLASGDYDNDGRIDFLVIDHEGHPLLLHNETQTSNHWITLDLRDEGRNKFAYGAHVVLRAGKRQWVGVVSPASSYLSSSDPRLHFGLGSAQQVDSIKIRWSGGHQQIVRNIKADRILQIHRKLKS
jgi:hypothetical protein